MPKAACDVNAVRFVQDDDVGSDYMNCAVTLSVDADYRSFGAMPLALLYISHSSHADNENLHYNTRGHRLAESQLSVWVVDRHCRCRCYILKAPYAFQLLRLKAGSSPRLFLARIAHERRIDIIRVFLFSLRIGSTEPRYVSVPNGDRARHFTPTCEARIAELELLV